ncbi:hypothetical protein C5167_013214 [Papaver somniferum]|uniref:Uncharacterized protein n=1 Tax=Papaver somniferum TaxID=3469 RepID=A0A4Y7IZP8_PAPSO|nr:hypothetical protein C5167_013214 [Papaver somniferum]
MVDPVHAPKEMPDPDVSINVPDESVEPNIPSPSHEPADASQARARARATPSRITRSRARRVSQGTRSISSVGSGSGRTLLISGGGVRRKNQIPNNCTEIVSKSHCLQNTKCKWCRSDVVDDMCFSSLESWRLPQQVFFCDQ